MNLALYVASGLGPKSVVLVAGQHFNRLPPQLRGCSYALLWPWDVAAVKAQVCVTKSMHFMPCGSAHPWTICGWPVTIHKYLEGHCLPHYRVIPMSALASPNIIACGGFDPLFQLWSLFVLQSVPVLVEGPHLLYNLNCYLAHTALLVQPLELPTAQAGAASAPSLSDLPQLSTVDVPLPLPRQADAVGRLLFSG